MRKVEINWKLKTLENLERVSSEAKSNSHLIKRTTELRKIPLDQFSVEDLRIMIGQNLSLQFLIPLSIEKLKENILAEGDFYAGDLLVAVTSIDNQFWNDNPELKKQLEKIMADNFSVIEENRLKLDKRFIKND
jgi:hypothetical protein